MRLTKIFFQKKTSLINSTIFSIIPLHVYASGQISSVTLQMFFSLLFLKFLLIIAKNQSTKNIVIFSITAGMLILTRGEFILIFLLLTLYTYFKKKITLANLNKKFLLLFF